MENSIDAFEISLVSGKPLEIYPRRKFPFPDRRVRREIREGRSEPPRRKEDSPLWKCQARRVNIWQPPSELPLISSLFSISPRRNIGHGSSSSPSRTNSSFPTNANTYHSRASPRGRSWLFHQYGFVCHLYSTGTISCRRIAANNCNFHPPNGGDGKLRVEVELWIRIVGSLRVSSLRKMENFRKVSILRIAGIL